MKNLIIIVLTLSVLAASCGKHKTDRDIELISKIENNLIPSVIIEGDSLENFSLQERMKHYNIPGVSIAFINNGKLKWAKGFGYLTYDSIKAVNENTLFQAASISKPVAAMAALRLVEEGRLGLDDNVNDHLIGWQVEENNYTADEKVTLRRILSHSAGLTVHGFGGYTVTDTVPSVIQVLNGEKPANSGRIFPDTIPGSIYRYSGGGYTVMQKMLSDITGLEFPALMREKVLDDIGMTNSTYQQPLPADLEENAAAAHNPDGNMVEGRWHTYPEMAAAGLWTTPTDLLKYALEVQSSLKDESNKIISSEMTKEMLTPQINSHGLGPAVGGENESLRFSHGGANKGFRCQLIAFANNGQGVAIMTNSDNGGQLLSEILRSFSQVYNWPIYKPSVKKIIEMPTEVLNSFVGNYSMMWQDNELILEIQVEDDHLHGIQQWERFEFDMYPESDLLFFNKEDAASFEFMKDESGNITEVIVQDIYNFKKKE